MATHASRPWRYRLQETIYESDTPAGKAFDLALIVLILASIVVVMLDSVVEYHARYGVVLFRLTWIFTILFTLEYILRLIAIQRPLRFVLSPLGVIDLLSILPSYLSFFIPDAQALLVLRALRLLRIFRIFKLTRFLTEMEFLRVAIRASLRKILIFMLVVITLVIVLGSVMFLVEGPKSGFTSIPESIYWAVVTVTTVGYGDISPITPLGKFISSGMMLIGYGIIAVPTGILTHEIAAMAREQREESNEACKVCGREGHDSDARHCKWCGARL